MSDCSKTHFSAVGVEATFRQVCHWGMALEVVCEAWVHVEGLLRALVLNLCGTERSDIVVNLHCGIRRARGSSLGASLGRIVGARFGWRRLSVIIPPEASIPARHRLSHCRELRRRGVGKFAPSNRAIQPPANMNAQSTRVLFRRQLLAGGRPTGQYRCLSCTVRQAQQPQSPPKPAQNRDGTTHFGFETVAEALKEQKGKS
jgi:hypothetical protein